LLSGDRGLSSLLTVSISWLAPYFVVDARKGWCEDGVGRGVRLGGWRARARANRESWRASSACACVRACLKEQLQQLEQQSTTEHKSQQDCTHLLALPLFHRCFGYRQNILIQILLIGLFCGPLGFTTTGPSGLPIFFSCALAKRMLAWRCCGVWAYAGERAVSAREDVAGGSWKLSRCGGA
jgi:hypothetical protein